MYRNKILKDAIVIIFNEFQPKQRGKGKQGRAPSKECHPVQIILISSNRRLRKPIFRQAENECINFVEMKWMHKVFILHNRMYRRIYQVDGES